MSGKDKFEHVWSQSPLYSGGHVACIEANGGMLVTAFGTTVNVLSATTGKIFASFDSPLEEDVILNVTATAAVPEERKEKAPLGLIAFSTESRQVFVAELLPDDDGDEGCKLEIVKSWTAAQHAIACLRFHPSGSHLASGATDGGLKVWDVFHHQLTHNYRGRGGIVTAVNFSASGTRLVAGTVEGFVSVIDFETKEVLAASRAFTGPVEAGCFNPAGDLVCLCRDRRVTVFEPDSLTERHAVVLRDHVASAAFLVDEAQASVALFVGTPEGVLVQAQVEPSGSVAVRSRSAKQPNASESEDAFRSVAIMHPPVLDGAEQDAKRSRAEGGGAQPQIVAADASQRIHFFTTLPAGAASVAVGLKTVRVIAGYLDQIFDLRTLPGRDEADEPFMRRVVASNSKNATIFDGDGSTISKELVGHSDLVTVLDVSPDGEWIVTGSKDETMRLWNSQGECVGVGAGHDGPITAVLFNKKMGEGSAFFIVTCGADEAVKLWDAKKPSASGWKPTQTTMNAHTGAIHCAGIAPNDTMLATGGKDKTVVLWTMKAKSFTKIGALVGHRRTVNAVQFSPADRLLLSASNDGAVKIWSLGNMSCARTLQHDRVGITQASFFNHGQQVVTGNAHGVVRVWALAAAEVIASHEAHTDRIWALNAVETEDSLYFVSGGADSRVAAWRDITEEETAKSREQRAGFLLATQKLQNAMRRGAWAEAFQLALHLKHPRHLRAVVSAWLAADETGCEDGIADIFAAATEADLHKALEFTRIWIANARHCLVASVMAAALLRAFPLSRLSKLAALKETLEGLAGYSQRHFTRVSSTAAQLHYVDFITRKSRPTVLPDRKSVV